MADLLTMVFEYLMNLCYSIVPDYVLAIILFTLITKILLLPLSLWTQRNSLKMVSIMPELNLIKTNYYGVKDRIGEEQVALYKREHYKPLLNLVPLAIQIIILMGMIGVIRMITDSGSVPLLGLTPVKDVGWTWLMPLGTGLSAVCLGFAQNHINPLQREQSKTEQWVTNGISITLALFLGAFVVVGVGIYWMCSNLFSILVQLACNLIMKPSRYVDYNTLRESKAEMDKLNSIGGVMNKELKKREKADYKRFFSVANKHLAFYSEKSGFYKYFENVIDELLRRSNIMIHYITSDPDDQIFSIAKKQPRIKPYYIGEKKLITLMMKMDADMVIMTMPDLENYHIKRSRVRNDVEYVYMFHGLASIHMVLRLGALDHFDTIFCVGPHQVKEIRETEKIYGLSPKRLIECGYGVIENLCKSYEKMDIYNTTPQILIAPSWQKDNIMDWCLDELLAQVLNKGYKIILRPHPEYIKRFPNKMDKILEKYSNNQNDKFLIQMDFSSGDTVYKSDLLITDWSTIAYEFSYSTKKPTLFIDTPMKIINPEYTKLNTAPLDITLRNEIGLSIGFDQLGTIQQVIQQLLGNGFYYNSKIGEIVKSYVYNFGHSGEIGSQYIIKSLKNR